MKGRVTEGWERLFAATQETDDLPEIARRASAWNPNVRILPDNYPDPSALRRRVEEMADGAGRLSVTTFHSFCARVLRSYPAEAGVDPLFQVLPKGEAEDAWDAAFRLFLRGEFGATEVSPEWERILLKATDPATVWRVIRSLCLTQRDLLRGEPAGLRDPWDFLGFLRGRFTPHVEYFRAFVAGIAAPEGDPAAEAFRNALPVLDAAWGAVLRGDLVASASRAKDGGVAFRLDLRKAASKKKFPRPEGPKSSDVRDGILGGLFALLEEVPEGDAAARFLVARADAALSAYEEAKGGSLDFMDLLLRAESLLASNPEVARRLSSRFRYIFVDEFQDTDPLQAKVLRMLTSDVPRGKLFVVGDPKQSIYEFLSRGHPGVPEVPRGDSRCRRGGGGAGQ